MIARTIGCQRFEASNGCSCVVNIDEDDEAINGLLKVRVCIDGIERPILNEVCRVSLTTRPSFRVLNKSGLAVAQCYFRIGPFSQVNI